MGIADCQLFDDMPVEVDPRAFDYGGAWQLPPTNGIRPAFGPEGLRWMHVQAAQIERPVLLDVGANTGSYALLAAHHRRMIVHAFEPVGEVFDVLRANIALNGLGERAYAYDMALDEHKGLGTMYVPTNPAIIGLALLNGAPARFTAWREEWVATTTLDIVYAAVGHVDLIKLDTEGRELPILRGGRELLRACRPALLLECEARNTAQHGYRPEDLTGFLEAMGYRWERLGKNDVIAQWEGRGT